MSDVAVAPFTGRRLLLTGGAGFIGSHLAERLLPGNDVVVLDTLRRNALGAAGPDRHPRLTLALGAVGEARWTYAVAKLATEHLAMNYWKQYGLPTCSIRPFNIYGPRQVGEGAVHHFIVRALRGETLQVHNDGSQIRAWCYVDDIVDGILLALTNEAAVGHAFNIGNPRSTLTIHSLAREILRLSSSGARIEYVTRDQPH